MKPVQIVDSDDIVIGSKPRDQIDYNNDTYRVAALWLTNSTGEVLLAQRVSSKDKDPGMWGPAAAGTLEEGETYESNIYKEAQEELGLTGLQFTAGPKTHIIEPRHYFCQWFYGKIDKPAEQFAIQKEEVAAVKWVLVAQLREDVKNNPDIYVPALPNTLPILLGDKQ